MLIDAKKMGNIKTEAELSELRELMQEKVKNGLSFVPEHLKKKEVDDDVINAILDKKSVHAP